MHVQVNTNKQKTSKNRSNLEITCQKLYGTSFICSSLFYLLSFVFLFWELELTGFLFLLTFFASSRCFFWVCERFFWSSFSGFNLKRGGLKLPEGCCIFKEFSNLEWFWSSKEFFLKLYASSCFLCVGCNLSKTSLLVSVNHQQRRFHRNFTLYRLADIFVFVPPIPTNSSLTLHVYAKSTTEIPAVYDKTLTNRRCWKR